MFNSSFNMFYFLFTFFTIFICVFFIPIFSENSNIKFENQDSYIIGSSQFLWPTPGYTTITSYFGKRFAPTSGASIYHSGIDIAAPTR